MLHLNSQWHPLGRFKNISQQLLQGLQPGFPSQGPPIGKQQEEAEWPEGSGSWLCINQSLWSEQAKQEPKGHFHISTLLRVQVLHAGILLILNQLQQGARSIGTRLQKKMGMPKKPCLKTLTTKQLLSESLHSMGSAPKGSELSSLPEGVVRGLQAVWDHTSPCKPVFINGCSSDQYSSAPRTSIRKDRGKQWATKPNAQGPPRSPPNHREAKSAFQSQACLPWDPSHRPWHPLLPLLLLREALPSHQSCCENLLPKSPRPLAVTLNTPHLPLFLQEKSMCMRTTKLTSSRTVLKLVTQRQKLRQQNPCSVCLENEIVNWISFSSTKFKFLCEKYIYGWIYGSAITRANDLWGVGGWSTTEDRKSFKFHLYTTQKYLL